MPWLARLGLVWLLWRLLWTVRHQRSAPCLRLKQLFNRPGPSVTRRIEG
jgi:hypothetical protein